MHGIKIKNKLKKVKRTENQKQKSKIKNRFVRYSNQKKENRNGK